MKSPKLIILSTIICCSVRTCFSQDFTPDASNYVFNFFDFAFPVRQNGKVGLMNPEGKTIHIAEYDTIFQLNGHTFGSFEKVIYKLNPKGNRIPNFSWKTVELTADGDILAKKTDGTMVYLPYKHFTPFMEHLNLISYKDSVQVYAEKASKTEESLLDEAQTYTFDLQETGYQEVLLRTTLGNELFTQVEQVRFKNELLLVKYSNGNTLIYNPKTMEVLTIVENTIVNAAYLFQNNLYLHTSDIEMDKNQITDKALNVLFYCNNKPVFFDQYCMTINEDKPVAINLITKKVNPFPESFYIEPKNELLFVSGNNNNFIYSKNLQLISSDYKADQLEKIRPNIYQVKGIVNGLNSEKTKSFKPKIQKEFSEYFSSQFDYQTYFYDGNGIELLVLEGNCTLLNPESTIGILTTKNKTKVYIQLNDNFKSFTELPYDFMIPFKDKWLVQQNNILSLLDKNLMEIQKISCLDFNTLTKNGHTIAVELQTTGGKQVLTYDGQLIQLSPDETVRVINVTKKDQTEIRNWFFIRKKGNRTIYHSNGTLLASFTSVDLLQITDSGVLVCKITDSASKTKVRYYSKDMKLLSEY